MKTAIFAALFALSALSPADARADGSDLAYYQQFQYTSSTDADGNISTRFLMSTYAQGAPGFTVGTNAQGQTIDADANLFLLPDGTFVFKYMEMTSQGAPVTFPMFMRFQGMWTVPADKLLVGDIAVGTRAVYETRNAVQLTFLKDLNTPGLTGKSVILDYGFSNETPDGP